MKLRIKKNVIFRDFKQGYGYLKNFDNSNEMCVDETGIYFINCLSKEYNDIDTICLNLYKIFNVNQSEYSVIKQDAIDFYLSLYYNNYIEILDNKEKSIEQNTDNTINKSNSDNDFDFKSLKCVLYTGTIIITENCTNKCIHCYNPSYSRDSSFMDEKTFLTTLEQFIDSGIVNLDVSGGEPLMHPNFTKFLAYTKKHDIRLRLITNGQLINEELAEYFKSFSFNQIQVTLYSLNEETHDSITNLKGSCESTKKAIQLMIEKGLPVSLSVPIMKKNRKDYIELYKWGKDIGVISITPNPFLSYTVDHTKSNENIALTESELIEFTKDLIILSKKNDFALSNSAPKKELNSTIFQNTFYSSLTVLPNGSIVPGTLTPDIVLGNVETDNIFHIWNNSKNLNDLRELRIKDVDDCPECDILDYCTVNIGDNWVANHDFLKTDKRLCKLYKAHLTEIINSNEKNKQNEKK